MSRIKTYDFEKFSVFDIKEFLEKKGRQAEFKFDERKNNFSLHITNTKLYSIF